MKQLFEIDLHDYHDCTKKFSRPSARGIIVNDGKIALVYSVRDRYYKFPGGGIRSGEDARKALVREVGEEVGLTVIPDSIAEFGSVMRRQRSIPYSDTLFEQENFYYTCRVEDTILEQNLDDYERDAEFVLRYTDIHDAIRVNDVFSSDDSFDEIMIKRELRVLQIIREAMIIQDLLPYAYLRSAGLDAAGIYAGEYADALGRLLEKYPDSRFLSELECVSGAEASASYILEHCEYGVVSPYDFGRDLAKMLRRIYASAELSSFAKSMYELWNRLPESIMNTEPFIRLCYADDPLISCGEAEETRR